jgi:hypothetical protein
LDGELDIAAPEAHYLLVARGLPVYFLLLVHVGVPIITVSERTSNLAWEMMLTSFLC